MSHEETGVRDVVVVGGGAAGLSAALTLARARRRTSVVDGGRPRNAPAAAVHGLLGHEGIAPADLLARGRAEVARYGGELIDDEVVGITRPAGPAGAFEVALGSGGVVRGRRVLLATGLSDELPDVPGVREQWGRGVLHCPFCHGWEVRDRRLGVLATDAMAVHKAMLFRQWSDDVVLFAGDQRLDAQERTRMAALGVAIVNGAVLGVVTEGGELRGVRVASGDAAEVVEVDALAVSTRMTARVEPFAGLGITLTEHPLGTFVAADEQGRTAVPGVWAAGNVSDLAAQVSMAAADGARAAQHIVADLMTADVEQSLVARAATRVATV